MDQEAMDTDSGEVYITEYSSDLIGNIRTHLSGLQGFDVMALELIQNADDAGANEVIFEIQEGGLIVRNDGRFTSCGDLRDKSCALASGNGYACDFHRIKLVGSGGKRERSTNIGRFGIGFVSVYQVTDHPIIRSAAVELTLLPESQQCRVKATETDRGTEFFLPWATNPESVGRRELGLSCITPSHIERLEKDIIAVLRRSLLFLRNVGRAEIRRRGRLVFACELERGESDELLVTFHPESVTECWLVLRADAAPNLAPLVNKYPHLAHDKRNKEISVAVRTDPAPLKDGLLYAYLPTQQSSGLPLHINADFYPEGDRKAIIFSGHQHEQHWNEALIGAAAERIVKDPEKLLIALGDVHFWELIDSAYQLATQRRANPSCFELYWSKMQSALGDAEIVLTADGSRQRPVNVLINKSTPLNPDQAAALFKIGGNTPSEALRSFQNCMNKLGADFLNLERLTSLYGASRFATHDTDSEVSSAEIKTFFQPLWSIAEDLLPAGAGKQRIPNPALQKFSDMPIVVTADGVRVTPKQTVRAPPSANPATLASILPRLAIAHRAVEGLPRLADLMPIMDLDRLVGYVQSGTKETSLRETVSLGQQNLAELYFLIVELDKRSEGTDETYESLAELAIWPTSHGLVSARKSLLPGSFTDPLGDTSLLDVSRLSVPVQEFLRNKLGVPVQTVETFVKAVLPMYFGSNGPSDERKYPTLIRELANHASILDKEQIRSVLQALPMVPTMNGGWTEPTRAYWRSEGLVDVLGDNKALWVDPVRVPTIGSVRSFLDRLEIRKSPSAQDLVERIIWIASHCKPTEEATRASAKAFYALCDQYEIWKGSEELYTAIDHLKSGDYLPADRDEEHWYSVDELHAPYRSEAFHSQANILAFRNTRRLKSGLLDDLGLNMEPDTELVVKHWLWCAETGTQPSKTVYQILNERAHEENLTLYRLRDKPCVYVDQIDSFVRPSDLYWTSPNLGRYALTIPNTLSDWKPLFDALGVKQAPECEDFVNILMEIVTRHYEQGAPLSENDARVYERCLLRIAEHKAEGEVTPEDWDRLAHAPIVRNVEGNFLFPDDVLFLDSHWCQNFFGPGVEQVLCRADGPVRDLFRALGVRRLSKATRVELVDAIGEERREKGFPAPLTDKSDVILRLLHSAAPRIRATVRDSLQKLTTTSADSLKVRGVLEIGKEEIAGPVTVTKSFFDPERAMLRVARPVDQSTWDSVLPSVINQLIPEDAGVDIPNLILMVSLLLPLSLEEAHAKATSACIPDFSDLEDRIDDEDLASIELPGLGLDPDEGADEDDIEVGEDFGPELEVDRSDRETSGNGIAEDSEMKGEQSGEPKPPLPGSPSDFLSKHTNSGQESDAPVDADWDSNSHRDRSRNSSGERKSSKHKKKWERRLLSYVKNSASEPNDNQSFDEKTTHNYAVEAKARAAVCEYEEARGRTTEQMPITHPGYDIRSVSPTTGDERLIEVKGLTGEWSVMGVGLSKHQFDMCRDCGDQYWLYVVELFDGVSEPNVYPIQNPAANVTTYMFDGNWREAVLQEAEDRFARFVPGCRIAHKILGAGTILAVETRGESRSMTIQFDDKARPTPHVPLNLFQISVLRPDED